VSHALALIHPCPQVSSNVFQNVTQGETSFEVSP
jgi:hypothetical protein